MEKHRYLSRLKLILGATLATFIVWSSNVRTDRTANFAVAPCYDPLLTIVILTFNRPLSLVRLLKSLSVAEYGCAPVDILIHVDAPAIEDPPAAEAGQLAKDFHWPHGRKLVFRRIHNAGLRRQWLEAFFMSPGVEYIAIFEDDMEASPQYYKFLSVLHRQGVMSSQVSALCLHPTGSDGHLTCGRDSFSDILFHSTVVCSWGPIWRASVWKEFVEFASTLESKKMQPFLPEGAPNFVTFNQWINEGRDVQSAWTARFLYQQGYKTLAYNFDEVRIS